MAPYVHFAARVDTETEKRIYKINSTIKKNTINNADLDRE